MQMGASAGGVHHDGHTTLGGGGGVGAGRGGAGGRAATSRPRAGATARVVERVFCEAVPC